MGDRVLSDEHVSRVAEWQRTAFGGDEASQMVFKEQLMGKTENLEGRDIVAADESLGCALGGQIWTPYLVRVIGSSTPIVGRSIRQFVIVSELT